MHLFVLGLAVHHANTADLSHRLSWDCTYICARFANLNCSQRRSARRGLTHTFRTYTCTNGARKTALSLANV